MKKKLGILTICLMMLFLITGCGSKTSISLDSFTSTMEEQDYVVYDVSSQYSSYEQIESAKVAKSSSGFQIEFYVLTDENEAQSMFNTNRTTFENSKGNGATETSASVGNYSTYSLTSGGYYMYVSRVDNTLLYAKVEDTYKSDVKDLVKKLGY